jgi:hypothetical protein
MIARWQGLFLAAAVNQGTRRFSRLLQSALHIDAATAPPMGVGMSQIDE